MKRRYLFFIIERKKILYIIFTIISITVLFVIFNTTTNKYKQTSALGNSPKIAIVIDDFGIADTTGVEEMFSINCPMTFAVMPNLPYSREHASRSVAAGYQVILHLPMEPIWGKANWLGPGAIFCDLSDEEIKERLTIDLESIPYAIGINNHTGSRATANRRVMRVILQETKERGLFFLDSRTNDKSVIADMAWELSMPFAERDVFLDGKIDAYEVKKQIGKLADVARKKGSAIGIGHVGQMGRYTANALRDMIPQLEKQGFHFVFVSELVNE